jgi:hypothetical protein
MPAIIAKFVMAFAIRTTGRGSSMIPAAPSNGLGAQLQGRAPGPVEALLFQSLLTQSGVD